MSGVSEIYVSDDCLATVGRGEIQALYLVTLTYVVGL